VNIKEEKYDCTMPTKKLTGVFSTK